MLNNSRAFAAKKLIGPRNEMCEINVCSFCFLPIYIKRLDSSPKFCKLETQIVIQKNINKGNFYIPRFQ